MKWLLSVCVAWSVAVALTSAADETTECPGMTDEKLTELKGLVVTDDVHEQLAGDYTEVWGPKPMLEKDEQTCIKTSRVKVDDKELSQSIYLKGEWFGGEKTKNGSLIKYENGVYGMKKHTGEMKGKIYILYAKNNVYAFYACTWCKGHGPSEEGKNPEDKEKKHDDKKKKNKLPFWATVSIRKEDLKTPLDAEVQKNVKEAVEKIQAHKELLGEIIEYPHPC